MQCRWLFAVALLARIAVHGEDKTPDLPRITAIAPFDLVSGIETTLRIRGVKLSNATEVRLPGGIKAEIKEKKAADIPNGLDAKDVGDTQIEAKLTLPADMLMKAIGQNYVDGPLGARLALEGGRIKVDAERRTSAAKVWAGGDCVAGGEDLTVSAVADGRDAAESIHRTLSA